MPSVSDPLSSAQTLSPPAAPSIWGTAGDPHILQIVIKNTSTMDFTLPLLWKIRQEAPRTKVSILYCVSDKRQIVRDGSYFSDFFKQSDIAEYDFGDFLRPGFRRWERLWRR